MGIRSRVKRVLKKALSRSDQDARSQHVSVQREVKPPESSPPPVEPKPRSKPVEAAKKAQSEKSAEAPAPSNANDLSPEQADKVARHFERARKGVLTFLMDNGGQSELADIHNFSERRFFIGHQKFSQLMEGLVDEELVSYSWEDGIATIMEKGKSYTNQ